MAKKKSKEEPEAAPDETESAQPAGEEVTSDIPETVPDDLADLSSLTDGMDDTDKTPMEASDNTESVESTENAAENGDAGGLDDVRLPVYLRLFLLPDGDGCLLHRSGYFPVYVPVRLR